MNITYIVLDDSTFYNVNVGRFTQNHHRMGHSTNHQMMKFPITNGIGVVRGD